MTKIVTFASHATKLTAPGTSARVRPSSPSSRLSLLLGLFKVNMNREQAGETVYLRTLFVEMLGTQSGLISHFHPKCPLPVKDSQCLDVYHVLRPGILM